MERISEFLNNKDEIDFLIFHTNHIYLLVLTPKCSSMNLTINIIPMKKSKI